MSLGDPASNLHTEAGLGQPDHAPAKHEIEAQLARILASPQFASSERLGAFLGLVVEEALAGRGHRLKGRTIAHDVYERGESFDPQLDNIVRVEAGRLRRRLIEYYATDGRFNSIRIEIPKGSYAARFTRSTTVPGDVVREPPAAETTPRRPLAKWLTAALAAAIIAVAGVGFWAGNAWRSNEPTEVGSTSAIAVLPFDHLGTGDLGPSFVAALMQDIATDLSRLSRPIVILASEEDDSTRSAVDVGRRLGVSHVVTGSARAVEGRLRVHARLLETASGTQIWADRYDRQLDDPLVAQADIARDVAAAIAFALPGRHPDEVRERHAREGEAYALFLETWRIGRPATIEERVQAALDLSRKIVELDPDFGGGYAAKSFSYFLLVLYGHSESPERDASRALELAEQAVAVDPDLSWGYISLARARLLGREHDQAIVAAESAVRLQPWVAETHGTLGLILILAGRPEAALTHIERAIELSGGAVRVTYWNYLGIAQYFLGRYAEAIDAFKANVERGGPTGPQNDVFLLASHVRLGQFDQARAVAERIRQRAGSFPVAGFFTRLLERDEDRDQLFGDLAKAGLALEGL